MLSQGESLLWPRAGSEERNIIKFAMQNRQNDDGLLCGAAEATSLISRDSNLDKKY